MIDKIIAFCFRKRSLFWVIALLIVAFGYYSWTRMKVEAYPEIGDVTAQVTTQVPGLAAEEIEQQITTPLERSLSNTPGLVTMRSSSTFGLSLITLVFRDGIDDYFARQRILERIGQVTLPPGVEPGLDPVTGSTGEIYRYTLESDSKNLMELSEIQRWIVIPAFRQVSGVVDVTNFGGFTREFQLQVDPRQMQRFGVSLNDIVAAINANSANAGGGRITRGAQSYIIRGIGQVQSLDDLGNIVVTQNSGVPVLIRDLGTLQFGHQEREGILGKNNNPDAIEGILLMLKYQNAAEVLKGVHAKVAELRKRLDPMGVKIVPYIDRDDLVQLTVDKVSRTVLEGVGLVCLVLMLFLGSPRSALVVAITIPLSLIFVFIMMYFTQMPANLFSLGAIDFGIIVNGAIVILEAILRRREERPDLPLTDKDILEMTQQVARPIFFATLIIITAYLPLFAFERAEAKLFTPMAFTVGYALFGSLLCTFSLIPGLAFTALRKPQKIFHNTVLLWLQSGYRNSLARLMKQEKIAYAIGLAALLAVVALGMTVGREFLPALDEGALWLQVQMPTGLSLDKASAMAGELRHTLLEFPEVSYAITQLGRNDDGTDPWTPSHIEVPVGLKPYRQWPAGETKADFLRKLNARFQQMPGFSVGISQPIIDMVNDAIGGAHSPLVMRVYGDSLQECRRIATDIANALQSVRGTASASIFQEPPIPQLVIKVDRAAAARFGITIADITNLIQTGIGGAPVTQVFKGDRVYNVTVRFARADKGSPEAIGSLFLNSSSGAKIALSQVADIKLQMGESTISHEMNHREVTVSINYEDRDLVSYLREAQDKITAGVHFDTKQYLLQWAGQFENQQRSQTRMMVIFGIVLALMAVFLFAEFGKLHQALLIMGVVPLAMLGGLVAILATDNTLNVATGVGFIALFGVSVQNGVILVANFNRMQRMGVSLHEAVLTAATERFRPVLMTATVASIGMLPAALATGVGTDVQRGLATVVVGGLIISTALTLFILPVYYFVIEKLVHGRQTTVPAVSGPADSEGKP